jgi:hypothetical protein
VDEEVCGKWMPRARTTCARRPLHLGECRTAKALADNRARKTARRVGKTLSTPEARAKWARKHKLKRYGLTQDDFDRMLEEQDYACAMCPTLFEEGDPVFIDHDHNCCPDEKRSCGRCVRGLLCLRCNVAVGYIERYGDLARAYLGKTATPQPQRPGGRRLTAI